MGELDYCTKIEESGRALDRVNRPEDQGYRI